MVGTSVRDRMNEQIMANITAIGHRHEQEARDALEEEHRHEHDADAEQRHEGRRHDLPRAVHDGGLDVLALLEVPVDVLDGDRGVVDQDADGQRQAAQGHDVQRLAERRQQRDRAQDGQRDRDGDDHRRAPAAEEQQDHQAGQHRGDHGLVRHAADTAPSTNSDWSPRIGDRRRCSGSDLASAPRRAALMPSMMDERRGRAVLQHLPAAPSGRRRHARCSVCGGLPSRTCATSRR